MCLLLCPLTIRQKQKPVRGTERVQQPQWKLARWLGLKAISSAAVTERDAALHAHLPGETSLRTARKRLLTLSNVFYFFLDFGKSNEIN